MGTAAVAAEWKVPSDKAVTGFGHVESVGYDTQAKVFYTSDFGPALKPADKDGKGKITKLSLDGKIIADGFLPRYYTLRQDRPDRQFGGMQFDQIRHVLVRNNCGKS